MIYNGIRAIENKVARDRVITAISSANIVGKFRPNCNIVGGIYIRQGNTAISDGVDGIRRYYEANPKHGAGILVHEERISK